MRPARLVGTDRTHMVLTVMDRVAGKPLRVKTPFPTHGMDQLVASMALFLGNKLRLVASRKDRPNSHGIIADSNEHIVTWTWPTLTRQNIEWSTDLKEWRPSESSPPGTDQFCEIANRGKRAVSATKSNHLQIKFDAKATLDHPASKVPRGSVSKLSPLASAFSYKSQISTPQDDSTTSDKSWSRSTLSPLASEFRYQGGQEYSTANVVNSAGADSTPEREVYLDDSDIAALSALSPDVQAQLPPKLLALLSTRLDGHTAVEMDGTSTANQSDSTTDVKSTCPTANEAPPVATTSTDELITETIDTSTFQHSTASTDDVTSTNNSPSNLSAGNSINDSPPDTVAGQSTDELSTDTGGGASTNDAIEISCPTGDLENKPNKIKGGPKPHKSKRVQFVPSLVTAIHPRPRIDLRFKSHLHYTKRDIKEFKVAHASSRSLEPACLWTAYQQRFRHLAASKGLAISDLSKQPQVKPPYRNVRRTASNQVPSKLVLFDYVSSAGLNRALNI